MHTKRRQDETEGKNENFKLITRKHDLFLSIAAKIAEKSTMQQKHGAVIVYKNKIIASGFNYNCSHMNNNYSIHAEVAAISQLFYNKALLEFCDIYVVRIAPAYDNCLKNSKPCKNCTKFINKYKLRNTYYSTNDLYEQLYLSC
jgi:deoxycytidylate deaminase